MSLAPSLFASPALGAARERSGSNPPDSRQSPFGAYASPPRLAKARLPEG